MFTIRTGRRLAVLMVLAIGATVSPVALPGVAVEVPRLSPAPGAPGVGDPYFAKDGNGGYDVTHYAVDVRYTVNTGELVGRTAVTARAKHDLSRFNLDLVLDADAVRVNGVPAAHRTSGRHELVVTPSAPVSAGSTFEVSVDYHGLPEDVSDRGSSPWIRSDDETMATNEPHIAAWWFPANDHPRDKATFDIAVTVPQGNQAISNGTHLGTSSADGWDTWRWRVSEPMATYLAFFAAGRFQVESGVARGLPYFNAVSMGLAPASRNQAMQLMRRSPRIVRWLETQLGSYPFSSTGGVTTSLSAGFALENQTRPTYPYLGNGRFGRDIVVHELAHQWLGDHVSVARWRDIWLNEGFATWFEWRYAEVHDGRSAQQRLRSRYRTYVGDDEFWQLRIGNPGPGHLFSFPVYERGAMTLQALRSRIGKDDFKRLLRAWVSTNASSHARVGEFQRLAERVSGEQLDGFFDNWLFRGRAPARTAANGLR